MAALPVFVFWFASQFVGDEIAIVSSFAASALVFATNRESGIIRLLAVQGFITISVAAAIGLALNNDKAFVAENIAGDFIIVAIGLGSLAIGQPLYGMIVREAAPGLRPILGVEHRAFVVLTLLFVAMNAGTGVARIFLLQEVSAADYALLSRAITWPVGILFVLAVYVLVSRAVRDHHALEGTPQLGA